MIQEEAFQVFCLVHYIPERLWSPSSHIKLDFHDLWINNKIKLKEL